jgi:type II secretory pathway pseudopilin PulG
MTGYRKQQGVTLVELLIAFALGALIVAGMSTVMEGLAQTQAAIQERNQLTEDGRFAMERMVRALSHSRRLLVPLADNSLTNWPENIREETLPASPPVGDSTKATAVLAVTAPEYLDLDGDGVPDADIDGDGRIDEDTPGDATWDLAPGLPLIDDDGDGLVDEGNNDSDDESTTSNDDPINGIDDDDDGNIDEDPASDNNNDGCPGLCGVDDDGDGLVDEGSASDDDEDGQSDEDFYGTVAFYLDNGVLKERMPVPWDISGGGLVNGLDYITSDIAENVTHLRFERLLPAGGAQVVEITLELTGPDSGETVNLHTQIRIGGAL